MNKFLKISAIVAMLSLPALATPYALDNANSKVDFKVSHLKLTNVDGKFTKFSAVIDYDESKKVLNTFEGNVEIASVDTASTQRDNHLRAPDIFNAEKYPAMTFKMTKMETGKIYGNLTIKDKTKEVVFSGTPKLEGKILKINATTKIKRSDFGVVWESSLKDSLVGDEVEILLSLSANAQ